MDLFDHFGTRDDQVVVAAVKLLAAKLLSGEVHFLQVGAHSTVKYQYLLIEGIQIATVGVISLHDWLRSAVLLSGFWIKSLCQNSICCLMPQKLILLY